MPTMHNQDGITPLLITDTRNKLGLTSRAATIKRPLHDPSAENILVLWNPQIDKIDKEAKLEATAIKKKKEKMIAEMLSLNKNKKTVHIVEDPCTVECAKTTPKRKVQCSCTAVQPD
ncbi:hypothetical protein BDB01DRAFT_837690 [Pilobolus umbonatus]|nr:hypothetical protein BDB01DRAFT_837690 [Pilobolus umbonatus]